MTRILHQSLTAAWLVFCMAGAGSGQSFDGANGPVSIGSIATPRPINPAAGTTNPSAQATQNLNPYLGSVPDQRVVEGELKLSLQDVVERGLRFNLGLIDSEQVGAGVRAERRRALAELLPQISARAEQSYQELSYRALGLKLPPQAGFQIPATSGAFGYSEARITAEAPALNVQLLKKFRAQQALAAASVLSTKDARDVVVAAVGAAYFQVAASEARVATAEAALASTRELERQVADQYRAEVSPEIETLRAQVELSTAEQRALNVRNDLEKDKLTLDRITGIPLAQAWRPSREYSYTSLPEAHEETSQALQTRFDLASTKQMVTAAELGVRAARAEKLPVIGFEASYGSAGLNPGNYNQVYSVGGGVSIPLFTGGRIRADVEQAEAALVQRRAEHRDLEGRVAYDVRVARLDAEASESAVKVAERNRSLAERALAQSEDRFRNGVTNYLEVVEAQEAVVAAKENYIASLFSLNVTKISLARALGASESRLDLLFGHDEEH